MKSVLLSIKPEYCAMIINAKKTLEVRKNKPKQDTPFKCYIYCTVSKPYVVYNSSDNWLTVDEFIQTGIRINGKVVGEFICDAVYPIPVLENGSIKNWNYYNLSESCLSYDEIADYIGVGNIGYAWHISNLVIYDKFKDLSEFYTIKKCNSCNKGGYESDACIYDTECKVPVPLIRPPQSWCYVDAEQNFMKIGGQRKSMLTSI